MVEALLPFYMVRQYDSFCDYLTDLIRCAESDLDKMRKEKSQEVARRPDNRAQKC